MEYLSIWPHCFRSVSSKEQGDCRFLCFHFSKSRCHERSCFLPRNSGPDLSPVRPTKENPLVMPWTSGCLINAGIECGPPSKSNKSWNVPLSHQPLFCLVFVLWSPVCLVLSRENGRDLRKNADRVKILLSAATSKERSVGFFHHYLSSFGNVLFLKYLLVKFQEISYPTFLKRKISGRQCTSPPPA